jgi:hypothetical protein
MAVRSSNKRGSSKREQIDTGKDNRFIRRPRRQVKQSEDVASSPSARRHEEMRADPSSNRSDRKRRRGEPAPIGGFTGKAARHWSVYRGNRMNVKRKPAARRKPAVKKALRRGSLNPMVEQFAPQSAINRAKRNKAGAAPGATRPSKSTARD